MDLSLVDSDSCEQWLQFQGPYSVSWGLNGADDRFLAKDEVRNAWQGSQPRFFSLWQTASDMRRAAVHVWRRALSRRGVEWEAWQKTIPPSIHQPLKSAYEAYTSKLDRLSGDRTQLPTLQPLEKAATSLRASTYDAASTHRATLEQDLEDVLSCLWISFTSPPVWALSTDEWLDSDLAAQKEIEHDVNSVLDEIPSLEEWCDQLDKFYAKSENPAYYQYVEQRHSSEYYQQNPTVFYEHLLYFIASTGKSRHFFPELPSPSFLEAVERKRYLLDREVVNWLRNDLSKIRNVDEVREIIRYLKKGEWRCPLKTFQHDKDVFMTACGLAMDKYIFLSNPAVPVTDLASLLVAEEQDQGRGTVYSLHGPVGSAATSGDARRMASLPFFYVPEGCPLPFDTRPSSHWSLESPTSIVRKWLLHCAPLAPPKASLSGLGWLKWHIRASQLLQWAESVELWRHHWFALPGESVADAFLRRLPADDDPVSEVFREYVAALRTKWTKGRSVVRREDLIQLWAR